MTRLTDEQICFVAQRAGFHAGGLILAIAVCLAESNGVTDVVNTTGNHPPSRDRGLWQINSYWHPEVTDAAAFDPDQCASAAFRISKQGSEWTAWATFTHGTHLPFVPRAREAIMRPRPAQIARHLVVQALMLHGDDVKAVQHCVGLHGADVDGWYGPKTAAAVSSWQSRHHQPVDGIVGPATTWALGLLWAG